MKKIILILTIIIVILAATLGCISFFKNKNSNNGQVVMDSEYALEIAELRYSNLLNFAQVNYMEISMVDGMAETVDIDGEEYFKITNYEDTVKFNVADELIEDFNTIAQIVEKDGNYYINIDSVGREKNPNYESTILIIKSFSEEQIICEAQSIYVNYIDGVSNKISQEFELKKIDGVWKVTKFELPY